MVAKRYHIVDSGRSDLKTIAPVTAAQAHRVIRRERDKPLIALSERALKKAIASGWW